MGDRVAIVGSRGPKMPPGWDGQPGFIGPLSKEQGEHKERMRAVWRYVHSLADDAIVVSGGARGVDEMAVRAAKTRTPRLQVCVYYADWQKGKGAGLARNRRIVANSDRVVAFWDSVSRGTAHTISVAQEMEKELWVFP